VGQQRRRKMGSHVYSEGEKGKGKGKGKRKE